jgi:hypothetical protein
VPVWRNLDNKKLISQWIAACLGRPPLPIFRVQRQEHASPAEFLRVSEEIPNMFMRRQPVSGIPELRFQLDRDVLDSKVSPQQNFISIAYGIAEREDQRIFNDSEVRSTVIRMNLESSLPGVGIPVIGPGGRIIVAAEAGTLTADIVTRKRAEGVASMWRKHDDLESNLLRRIAERSGGHRITELVGTFGYFELSKYERQEWLRPTFLVSVRMCTDSEVPGDSIEWADAIVEPASTSPGVEVWDGLGRLLE